MYLSNEPLPQWASLQVIILLILVLIVVIDKQLWIACLDSLDKRVTIAWCSQMIKTIIVHEWVSWLLWLTIKTSNWQWIVCSQESRVWSRQSLCMNDCLASCDWPSRQPPSLIALSVKEVIDVSIREAGVETQKDVRGEIGGWGRVPFNEPYTPSLSTIYDGA